MFFYPEVTCNRLGRERCLPGFLLSSFALRRPLLHFILHLKTISLFLFLPLPLFFGGFLCSLIRELRGDFYSWGLWRREVMASTWVGLQQDKQRLFRGPVEAERDRKSTVDTGSIEIQKHQREKGEKYYFLVYTFACTVNYCLWFQDYIFCICLIDTASTIANKQTTPRSLSALHLVPAFVSCVLFFLSKEIFVSESFAWEKKIPHTAFAQHHNILHILFPVFHLLSLGCHYCVCISLKGLWCSRVQIQYTVLSVYMCTGLLVCMWWQLFRASLSYNDRGHGRSEQIDQLLGRFLCPIPNRLKQRVGISGATLE